MSAAPVDAYLFTQSPSIACLASFLTGHKRCTEPFHYPLVPIRYSYTPIQMHATIYHAVSYNTSHNTVSCILKKKSTGISEFKIISRNHNVDITRLPSMLSGYRLCEIVVLRNTNRIPRRFAVALYQNIS